MKRPLIVLLVGLVVLPTVRADDDAQTSTQTPVALVQTTSVTEREVDNTLPVFGQVEAAPQQQLILVAPRESRVASVAVVAGEAVRQGQALLTLAPTPASRAAFVQAQSAERYAKTALAHMQALFKEHLATRDQVAAAQQASNDADATLANARAAGGAGSLILRAPRAGVVSALTTTQGEQLAANSALLTLALHGALMVRLGVAPETLAAIRVGTQVSLRAVYDPTNHVAARVTSLGGALNESTGLADVFVRLPAQARGFLPGTSVQGTLVLKHVKGSAVPRNAVLRDGNQAYVFIVKHQIAQRVSVSVLTDDGKWIAVKGDIRPGDVVVTLGNYELSDGMKVRETAR